MIKMVERKRGYFFSISVSLKSKIPAYLFASSGSRYQAKRQAKDAVQDRARKREIEEMTQSRG